MLGNRVWATFYLMQKLNSLILCESQASNSPVSPRLGEFQMCNVDKERLRSLQQTVVQ